MPITTITVRSHSRGHTACRVCSAIVLLLWLTIFSPALLAAELIARVDRTEINEDESLQLTVGMSGDTGNQAPDFALLRENFDIYNQQRSNQFQLNRSGNGNSRTSWTQWTLTLTPRKTGKLLIPSFSVNGAFSDAIEINVNKLTDSDPVETRDIFATVAVSKPEVYVQEQLLLTVKIHSAVRLQEFVAANELDIDNVILERVASTGYRKSMGGRIYSVEEISYAIFPQQSGEITIPALRWTASISNPDWRSAPLSSPRHRIRRISTEAKTITVHPRPQDYSGSDWLPSTNIELEQHWSTDPSRFVVGEPITRSITLIAQGLTSSQLPPLPAEEMPGVRVYNDQPQFDDMRDQQGVKGFRIENYAIVPNRAGKMTLPEVVVDWWDTNAGQQRQARLAAQEISVAPAAITSSSAQPAIQSPGSPSPGTQSSGTTGPVTEATGTGGQSGFPPDQNTQFWLLVSNAILAAISLLLLTAWLRARRNTVAASPPEATADPAINRAFHQLRRACADNDPHLARRYLGLWGQLYWALPHLASLREVSALSRSPTVTKELEQLDEILYGTKSGQALGGKWEGKPLWKALVDVKQGNRARREAASTPLPPLYPQ